MDIFSFNMETMNNIWNVVCIRVIQLMYICKYIISRLVKFGTIYLEKRLCVVCIKYHQIEMRMSTRLWLIFVFDSLWGRLLFLWSYQYCLSMSYKLFTYMIVIMVMNGHNEVINFSVCDEKQNNIHPECKCMVRISLD